MVIFLLEEQQDHSRNPVYHGTQSLCSVQSSYIRRVQYYFPSKSSECGDFMNFTGHGLDDSITAP